MNEEVPIAYADMLRERFPDLDPRVEDLFLFETHQIAGLPDRAPLAELAVVLSAHPEVHRYFVARHPPIAEFLDEVLATPGPGGPRGITAAEEELLWELADLIVYQRAPEAYDAGDDRSWVPDAVADVVDLAGKVVIDAGAGTGGIAFAVTHTARQVFAVEPVANLRRYMRDQASRAQTDNLFVLDGFLHAIPLPPASADVLLTCNAIGWDLPAELSEIERVVKPGGTALHLFRIPHPAPDDDPHHHSLLEHGYEAGTYREGPDLNRRYWKQI